MDKKGLRKISRTIHDLERGEGSKCQVSKQHEAGDWSPTNTHRRNEENEFTFAGVDGKDDGTGRGATTVTDSGGITEVTRRQRSITVSKVTTGMDALNIPNGTESIKPFEDVLTWGRNIGGCKESR